MKCKSKICCHQTHRFVMNKKGLEFSKLISLMIAVIILILLVLFSTKFSTLKDIFLKLFKGFGGLGG